MGKIFNMDNAFFRGVNKVVDCIVLSFLWVIFSIPLFTIGASTSALYHSVHKTLRRKRGYAASNFWEGFKGNFKKSTLVWIPQGILLLIMSFSTWLTYQWLQLGSKYGVLFIVYVIILLYAVVWVIFTRCYEARFDNSVKNIMKNAAIFQVVHLPSSLLVFVLMLVSVLLVWVAPILMFILPGAVFSCYEIIMEKIFRKYMSEEDLQKELEEDQFDKE